MDKENIDTSKKQRKYAAEAGLNLWSAPPALIRPTDISKFVKNLGVRKTLEGFNIYVIGRRPRIGVCPQTLRAENGLLRGDFLIYTGSSKELERFEFCQELPFMKGGQPVYVARASAVSHFDPDISIFSGWGERVSVPTTALIANSSHGLGDRTNVEVLYIGQGFGRTGKRLAIDRLSAHSTLKRVQAEMSLKWPNEELLIFLFQFGGHRNIISTAGDFSLEPTASPEEERQHFKEIQIAQLDRKTRINLAEAALIHHFKPEYNVTFKNSFKAQNSKKLKVLKKVFEKDLSGLMVEMDTSSLRTKLVSKYQPPKSALSVFGENLIQQWQSAEWRDKQGITTKEIDQLVCTHTHTHITRVPLYSSKERESFLDALPWGGECQASCRL